MRAAGAGFSPRPGAETGGTVLYTGRMLPSPTQRAFAGGLAVLGAVAAALAAAYLPAPFPWLYWLAIPLTAFALAQLHASDAARLRGLEGFLRLLLAGGLCIAGGLLCQLLIGPLLAGLRTGDRLYPALGLAAIAVGLLFAQWRTWPWFALLYTSRLQTENAQSTLVRRLLDRGEELSQADDAYFRDGIGIAGAQLVLLAAPVGAPLWPADLRIWLLVLLLALLGLVELILRWARRAQRRPPRDGALPSFLLTGAPDAADEITDPTGTPIALAELPSGPNQELLLAARRGDAAAVREALAAGADANTLPTREAADQRSPLIAAATAADLGGLRALIAGGAEVNRIAGGLSALLAATRDSYAGRIEAVMTLLANGADANLPDDAGNTPLHFAALTREPGVVQSLLDAGARLDAINREGMTPLAVAAEAGNWSVVEFLIKRGAKADVENATPALLFAAAVDGDDPKGVKLLLKAKARINAPGPQRRTALMVAALTDNAEIAEALMAAGAEIDARDESGHSALLEAARAGANRVLRRLVFHKPDAQVLAAAGRGALHLAACSATADSESVRLLLALGCQADLRDEDGRSAADVAASAGRWPLVRVLDPEYPVPSAHSDDGDDEARAPTSIQPDPPGRLLVRAALQGRFPLFLELLGVPGINPTDQLEALQAALPHQDRRYVEALLEAGLDAFARVDGDSVWERLCAESPVPLSTLDTLLERAPRMPGARQTLVPGLCKLPGTEDLVNLRERAYALDADPNACDLSGRPCLSIAVSAQPIDWIARLVAAGADPNASDPAGATALTVLCWARRSDAREIAPLLIRAGADPARATRDGSTPAGIARMTGQFEIGRAHV